MNQCTIGGMSMPWYPCSQKRPSLCMISNHLVVHVVSCSEIVVSCHHHSQLLCRSSAAAPSLSFNTNRPRHCTACSSSFSIDHDNSHRLLMWKHRLRKSWRRRQTEKIMKQGTGSSSRLISNNLSWCLTWRAMSFSRIRIQRTAATLFQILTVSIVL